MFFGYYNKECKNIVEEKHPDLKLPTQNDGKLLQVLCTVKVDLPARQFEMLVSVL